MEYGDEERAGGGGWEIKQPRAEDASSIERDE